MCSEHTTQQENVYNQRLVNICKACDIKTYFSSQSAVHGLHLHQIIAESLLNDTRLKLEKKELYAVCPFKRTNAINYSHQQREVQIKLYLKQDLG